MKREDDLGPDEGSDRAIRDDRGQFELIDRARRRRVARLLSVLALVVILIVFIIRNSQRVPIDFVFVDRHARLIWIMLACAVLGGLVGFLVGRPGKQFRRDKDKDRGEDRDRKGKRGD